MWIFIFQTRHSKTSYSRVLAIPCNSVIHHHFICLSLDKSASVFSFLYLLTSDWFNEEHHTIKVQDPRCLYELKPEAG